MRRVKRVPVLYPRVHRSSENLSEQIIQLTAIGAS
jgi:hypothetical protein